MLDQINIFIQQDSEAKKTFNDIITNKTDMFAAKFSKLEKLND